MPKFVNNIELPEYAAKPVYAGVGATDLAVEKVREAVTDVQTKVTTTVTGLRNDVTGRVAEVQKTVQGFEPKTLQDKAVDTAKARRTEVEQRLSALQTDALELPARVQSDLKVRVDENVATVTGLYTDLAKRGQGVVGRIRGAQVEAERAKQGTPTSTQKSAAQKSAAQKSTAQKSTAQKSTAKKAPAKKAPAKKSTAKKSTAQKSTQKSTQQSAAKKSTANKSTTQSTTQGTAKKA